MLERIVLSDLDLISALEVCQAGSHDEGESREVLSLVAEKEFLARENARLLEENIKLRERVAASERELSILRGGNSSMGSMMDHQPARSAALKEPGKPQRGRAGKSKEKKNSQASAQPPKEPELQKTFAEVSKGGSTAKTSASGAALAQQKPASKPQRKVEKEKHTLRAKPIPPPQRASVAKATGQANTHEKGAVLVLEAKEGLGFIDAYRAIRERTTVDQHVAKLLRTSERKMFLRLNPNAGCQELLQLVQVALKDVGEAHLLIEKQTAAITGIDMLATEEDIVAAVKRQTGVTVPIDAVRLWRRHNGLQKAHLKLPRGHCQLLNGSTITIGNTRCTVQALLPPAAKERLCFRCFGQGHKAESCKGPDFSNRKHGPKQMRSTIEITLANGELGDVKQDLQSNSETSSFRRTSRHRDRRETATINQNKAPTTRLTASH
ncbi:gag-like protein [Anopheles sinensis]|uniref:Gag-like protein n=1 Tax=Anopheles sinensis TaxID=74873 RepID=A0A084VBD6_ANOSI|nr:gag-like protein [Anopheles sinensis]